MRILNHCTTREVPHFWFIGVYVCLLHPKHNPLRVGILLGSHYIPHSTRHEQPAQEGAPDDEIRSEFQLELGHKFTVKSFHLFGLRFVT